MKVREALTEGTNILAAKEIENPALDSQIILGYVLKKDRLYLLTHDDIMLSSEQADAFNKLLKLRCRHIPIAYIIGEKEFYGIKLHVKPGVLIPRPETEFAVEETLNAILDIKKPKVADICCGSGAISVAIAANNQNVRIYASDISDISCEITRINVNSYNLQDRIFVLKGDLLEPFKENNIRDFDVIVSNPPYIPKSELANLPPDVKNEPESALNGGLDGLMFYRKIAFEAPRFLKPQGKIIFEIGWNQAEAVRKILLANGFTAISVVKDYAGFDRVISGSLNY